MKLTERQAFHLLSIALDTLNSSGSFGGLSTSGRDKIVKEIISQMDDSPVLLNKTAKELSSNNKLTFISKDEESHMDNSKTHL